MGFGKTVGKILLLGFGFWFFVGLVMFIIGSMTGCGGGSSTAPRPAERCGLVVLCDDKITVDAVNAQVLEILSTKRIRSVSGGPQGETFRQGKLYGWRWSDERVWSYDGFVVKTHGKVVGARKRTHRSRWCDLAVRER